MYDTLKYKNKEWVHIRIALYSLYSCLKPKYQNLTDTNLKKLSHFSKINFDAAKIQFSYTNTKITVL